MIRETQTHITLVRTDADIEKALDAREDLRRIKGTWTWEKVTKKPTEVKPQPVKIEKPTWVKPKPVTDLSE